MAETYYVKSLDYVRHPKEDIVTMTLDGKEKVQFQTVRDMVKRRLIAPNTASFGQQRRLSTTILDENYLTTYRPQGIIFHTEQKPDYVLPFDLGLLSTDNNPPTRYYMIKKDVPLHYNRQLIKGWKKFIFKNFEDLKQRFPTPQDAWEAANGFRISKGYKALPSDKHRFVDYNEAVFYNPVKIEPVALFGYRQNVREMAKELGMLHFSSAKKFCERMMSQRRI